MLHPVGSQSPNVYWRRRLIVLGAVVIVIVLAVITVSALTSSGSGSPTGSGSGLPVADGSASVTASPAATRSASPARSTTAPASAAATSGPTSSATTSPATTSSAGSASGSPASVSSSPAVVLACRSSDLSVAAVVGRSTYQVGDRPMVELQVTNVGAAPCVQDLADKQVLLKVYNGVSRVWGSHDCQTQPGTDDRTLAVGAPVRVSVSWSGETSQPNCAGTRQHVGAGTYTLYATLSGKTGRAARFTIN